MDFILKLILIVNELKMVNHGFPRWVENAREAWEVGSRGRKKKKCVARGVLSTWVDSHADVARLEGSPTELVFWSRATIYKIWKKNRKNLYKNNNKYIMYMYTITRQEETTTIILVRIPNDEKQWNERRTILYRGIVYQLFIFFFPRYCI